MAEERPAFIWEFDVNFRVYRKGKGQSGPVWRDHWRRWPVVGETTRSWILDNGTKVPKKDADARCFAFSEADIDKAAFIEQAWSIADAVRKNVKDYDTLKQIADLAGYTEKGA